MAENKDLKTKLQKVWIAVKDVFQKDVPQNKNDEPKKPLTRAIIEQEVSNYIRENGFDPTKPEEFQIKFAQYLREKNYSFDNIDESLFRESSNETLFNTAVFPKNIRKITTNLNEYTRKLAIFADTTGMMAGMVCYTIDKIEPTNKIPYTTYKPSPRIITQIHDSGVNGGTIFLTYEPKFVKTMDLNSKTQYKVIAENEIVYSPLTKIQAEYTCLLLNAQSRILYRQKMKEIMKQRQIGEQKTK